MRFVSLLIFLTACQSPHVPFEPACHELRHAIVQNKPVYEMQKTGELLVAHYGRQIAWEAALKVWWELAGGAPLNDACDAIYMAYQSNYTKSAAWMICYKDYWL